MRKLLKTKGESGFDKTTLYKKIVITLYVTVLDTLGQTSPVRIFVL